MSHNSHDGGSRKIIVFALLSNFGIALAKFGAATFTGSASLLAEAIHSLVDTSNQALLLFGNKVSLKKPTEQHPLGYSRESFFWSFIVAILLFSLGGLFAIYEGAHKLLGPPEEQSHLSIALIVLAISMVLEGFSFYACLKEVLLQNPKNTLWHWFQNTTQSDLLVVFTEDLAAMVGLLCATLFLLISWYTGNPAWDQIGSIVVGVLLVGVAILLAVEIKSLMIGEAPSKDYRSELQRLFSLQIPGSQMLRFIALQTGPKSVLVSCKIHPGTEERVKELILSINKVEAQFKATHPEIQWLFVEPDFEA